MAGEKYDGGEDNDGLKRGVISPNDQMILPVTSLKYLIQLRIRLGMSTKIVKEAADLRAVLPRGLPTMA